MKNFFITGEPFFESYLKSILMASRVLRNAGSDDPGAGAGAGGGAGEGDKGGKGAGGNGDPNAQPPAGGGGQQPPKGQEPPAKEPPKGETAEERKKAIEDAVAKALADKEAADKRTEAEKQGEFETLYNDLKPKYEALEAKHTKLETTVKELVKEKRKGLSEKYAKLDPKYEDQSEELKWLESAMALQAEDAGQPPAGGNHGNPTPGDAKKEAELIETTRKAMLKQAPVARM